MAKFVFRLQNYLNIKKKLEEQKNNEYGQAVATADKEKQVKEKIKRQQAESIEELRQAMAEKIDATAMKQYNQYINLLKYKEKEQEIIVKKAMDFADEKRQELVEKMRERKMLETLKEKNYAEYINEQKLAEQKMVDELVSFKFNDNKEEN